MASAFLSGAAKENSTAAGKQLGKAPRSLLIAGVVLLLVAVTTAFTYRVVMRPGRSVFLLPDGNVMAYVNFTPMHWMNMDTSSFTSDPQYQGFVNETGLRVDHDIENIAISANTDGGSDLDMAMIVTGAFDHQRLSAFVGRQEGVRAEAYGGKTIFSARVNNQTARLCILDSKMVAITLSPAAESMHAIIDKSAGAGSAPSLYENYYGDVPFASPIWAIVRVPSSDISAPAGMNLNFLKNSVTIVSIRYTGSVRFRGEFIAENQDDATNIFKALDGSLAMVKLAGGRQQNDPVTAAVMNSLEITQNGNHVVVSMVVPQDLLQKVAQQRQAHQL